MGTEKGKALGCMRARSYYALSISSDCMREDGKSPESEPSQFLGAGFRRCQAPSSTSSHWPSWSLWPGKPWAGRVF